MAYICHGNEHFVLGGPVSSNTYQPSSMVGAKPIGIIAILAYSWNQQLAINIIGDILLLLLLLPGFSPGSRSVVRYALCTASVKFRANTHNAREPHE